MGTIEAIGGSWKLLLGVILLVKVSAVSIKVIHEREREKKKHRETFWSSIYRRMFAE